jgi:2-haloacid dehalogenase
LPAVAVPVRALAFDVFGTLVDWRAGVTAAFALAGLEGDPSELADDWRGRYAPALADVNRGARPWSTLDDLHLATLDEMLAARGIDGVDDAVCRTLVHAWHQLDPWPDVRDGLELLRRTYITATLSNGHIALLVDLARHGDLRFDAILSAELAGCFKPAPQPYRAAARLLGVEPHELMLVAAHPSDLAGARAAGLRTAYLDRPEEHGRGSPPRTDPEADVSAASLTELAERLAG